MRICLSMIVKNESAVIERCLRTVLPVIDSWAIVDTGSTDGTQDIIRHVLAPLPGELIERPWVDFATNRNQALELSRQYGDYSFFIDADEVLEVQPGFSWGALGADGYRAQIVYANTVQQRVLLVKSDVGWTWQGVLHEHIVAPANCSTDVLRGLAVRALPGGARSQLPPADKYGRDAEVLLRALVDEPNNVRYRYYLAQSLRDAGRLAEATSAYTDYVDACAELGLGGEEIYYAKWQIASLKERNGAEHADIVAAYIDAYDERASRAEAPFALARYLLIKKRFEAARLFARIAATLPIPDDVILVDRDVHDWQAREIWMLAAFHLGDKSESRSLCSQLLDCPTLPQTRRDRVRQLMASTLP